MSYIRQKAAGWFTPVAVLLLLWGLMGAGAFAGHLLYDPATDPAAGDWERTYYAALPVWFTPVYAVAVFGGLLGSVALLMRSRLADWLYILSLVGVVVQFGYVFLATDIIAAKGLWTAIFPLAIAAIAVFQIWLARYAIRRGWVR